MFVFNQNTGFYNPVINGQVDYSKSYTEAQVSYAMQMMQVAKAQQQRTVGGVVGVNTPTGMPLNPIIMPTQVVTTPVLPRGAETPPPANQEVGTPVAWEQNFQTKTKWNLKINDIGAPQTLMIFDGYGFVFRKKDIKNTLCSVESNVFNTLHVPANTHELLFGRDSDAKIFSFSDLIKGGRVAIVEEIRVYRPGATETGVRLTKLDGCYNMDEELKSTSWTFRPEDNKLIDAANPQGSWNLSQQTGQELIFSPLSALLIEVPAGETIRLEFEVTYSSKLTEVSRV